MYQDNAYMSSNGPQWFSLPSIYTAPGNQQNFRVQSPVPDCLTPEASVSYQYQSLNPGSKYVAPESPTIPQNGLTDHRPAYYYETPGTFSNQSLSENNSYQTHLMTSIIVYGSQSKYATCRKDQRLEAFVDAICRGDLDRDINSNKGVLEVNHNPESESNMSWRQGTAVTPSSFCWLQNTYATHTRGATELRLFKVQHERRRKSAKNLLTVKNFL